jgi:hypothetical protein
MRQMNTDLHDAPRVSYLGAAQMAPCAHAAAATGRPQEVLRRDFMGDLQLYGMTNPALGEYRTFKQRSLNLL